MSEPKDWVDFRLVKSAVSFRQVLDRYQVDWLRKSGSELRGKCPIHQGEGERTFHVNLEKGAFNCFSCRARGNVLDFVAAMERCSVRDAALKLRDWFGVASDAHPSPTPTARQGSATAKSNPAHASDNDQINPPLAFQLRVDPTHDYGKKRGITSEKLEEIGAGLCLSKGMFAGRFVIPLHDEQGRLVGYVGRSLSDGEPKYLFPSREKGFYKSHLVFNLHRVIKRVAADEPVVVVEGFFDCLKVEQAGFPCVALLGASLSDVQEELLVSHFNRLVLLFDGDDAGRSGAADALVRLARKAFVRVIDLADGQQPDSLAREQLQELLRACQ